MDIASPAPTSAGTSVEEGRIVAAAHGLKKDAIALLVDLVREPSLLGEEAGAQQVVRRAFDDLGVAVHEFPIDEARLTDMINRVIGGTRVSALVH